jgi:hypothetical protein
MLPRHDRSVVVRAEDATADGAPVTRVSNQTCMIDPVIGSKRFSNYFWVRPCEWLRPRRLRAAWLVGGLAPARAVDTGQAVAPALVMGPALAMTFLIAPDPAPALVVGPVAVLGPDLVIAPAPATVFASSPQHLVQPTVEPGVSLS